MLILSALAVYGCESDAQTGALIGTAIGAGVGQAVGGDTESTLIGAGVGAAGGYMIGNEQDKQKAQSGTTTQPAGAEEVIVNITNSNGSITPVKLQRKGAVYIGPKGEYYDHLPAADELKPVYGF
jgi:hypothetical protein